MNLYRVAFTVKANSEMKLVGLVSRVGNLANLHIVFKELDKSIFSAEL